jgi:hypothetical protein
MSPHIISLLFLLNAACLAEKQQIPILYVWFNKSGLEPTIYHTSGEHANHWTTDAFNLFVNMHMCKLKHIGSFITLLIIQKCIANKGCHVRIYIKNIECMSINRHKVMIRIHSHLNQVS